MIVFKKNQIVTIAMVCLLIIAGYINFVYTSSDKKTNPEAPVSANIEEEPENYGEAKFVNAPADTKTDYFNETKLNKEKSRSEALALIKEVADNENADESAKVHPQWFEPYP